jgi:hypothetical protein
VYVTAFFTSEGVPTTGLSALISIWRVSDNSLLVNDAAMTEVAGGWYKYDFSAYDASVDYAIRCDGSATLLGNDRYKFAANNENAANVDAILTDTAAMDARLPADPSDESNQLAQHAATQADIAALNDLAQADVQTAMTAQGYTTARAPYLDELAAANIPADLDSVKSSVEFCESVEGGKQELTTDGGGMLKIYEDDNVTPVANFRTYNAAGDRATQNVTKRERI